MEECWTLRLASYLIIPPITSVAVGFVDVALLQATLIWAKCWTRTTTNIVTVLVFTVAVLLTGSTSLPFGGILTTDDTTKHNILNGTIADSESNISDLRHLDLNVMLLYGIFWPNILPFVFKLPSSGMLDMFLAMVGMNAVVPSEAHLTQGEDLVVFSILVFAGINVILSGFVSLGFRKFILSKSNPDLFLQSYLPSTVSFLAFVNTITVLQQNRFFVEMIPLWLKIILTVLVAFVIWIYMKRCHQSCIRCCTPNGFEHDESHTILEQEQPKKILELILPRIATRCFRPKWEHFMNLLGVPKEDIDEIKYNYSGCKEEQVYRCLRRWQEKNPERATLEFLIEKSSPRYLYMDRFNAILNKIGAQGGNANVDCIIIENDEDRGDDIMEPINISFQLKVQCVCAIFIHGSAVMRDMLGPTTSIWLIPAECRINGLPVLKYIVPRLTICIGAMIGVTAFGHRIVANVGDGGLCTMTPLRCFCIEIGFALTTLLASLFGLPLSSTIWKIASVPVVGFVLSKEKPNHKFCFKLLMMVLVCGVISLGISTAMTVAYKNEW